MQRRTSAVASRNNHGLRAHAPTQGSSGWLAVVHLGDSKHGKRNCRIIVQRARTVSRIMLMGAQADLRRCLTQIPIPMKQPVSSFENISLKDTDFFFGQRHVHHCARSACGNYPRGFHFAHQTKMARPHHLGLRPNACKSAL